jgi:hypothetical protein
LLAAEVLSAEGTSFKEGVRIMEYHELKMQTPIQRVLKETQEFLSSYVESLSVPLRRERPEKFAARLVSSFALFTLPLIPDDLFNQSLRIKCLYGLWNTVLDDRIDCDQEGQEEIIDTLAIITGFFRNERVKWSTSTGRIMSDFLDLFSQIPSGPNTRIAKDFLCFDLLRITNAFNYERIVQDEANMTTLAEYMEFSPSTIDPRALIDVDLGFAVTGISPHTIAAIREVFMFIGIALRLSNDLLTLTRESRSEKSLNSAFMWDMERLGLNSLFLRARKTHSSPRNSVHSDITSTIDFYKKKAVSRISHITEIDVNFLVDNMDSLIKEISDESFSLI